MSTFKGQILEFPDIRIDYFRHVEGARPPLAGFLSHIHSDHLAGLESLKAPFVYCSAATRELLLRLERYPHRINFQLGILESRKQHYKHLKNLLKPLPLETPTRIEIAPGNEIQVTLFDANHCTGAVMFLFEGNGQAVLYTGDIRSEPWFVNSLRRNPLLIEYTSGLKPLDCIYLDTSFTDDIPFPTKAEGIKELLQKVASYPADTKFHLAAWTFGYEEVWIALSNALKSPIHVDKYKMRLYQSLRRKSQNGEPNTADDIPISSFLAAEAPALIGHQYANHFQSGCLTLDPSVRIHSCEKNTGCSGLDDNTVWIRPIISRISSGKELNEIGVGGGAGDLTQRPELELDNAGCIEQIMSFFKYADPSMDCMVEELNWELLDRLHSGRKTLFLDDMGLDGEEDEMPLKKLVKVLIDAIPRKYKGQTAYNDKIKITTAPHNKLPQIITFPYSRHSSYRELCDLLMAFGPVDVYPCTVDELQWHEGVSMESLFGPCCNGRVFRHDLEMRNSMARPDKADAMQSRLTQTTSKSVESDEMVSFNNHSPLKRKSDSEMLCKEKRSRVSCFTVSLDAAEYPTNSEFCEQNDWERPNDDCQSLSFFDLDDKVYRCVSCSWEMWSPTGQCTGCEAAADAYYEHDPEKEDASEETDPDNTLHPLEWTDNVTDVNADSELLEDYLDGSSAYDSVSDAGNEEYEINSFIDNTPNDASDSDDDDGESSSNLSEVSETDYKDLHHKVSAENTKLHTAFRNLIKEFKQYRMMIVGSDYHSDSDPCEADYQGESHASAVGQSQMAKREEAFDAAQDVKNGGWYRISLMSTGDNHTKEEVEL